MPNPFRFSRFLDYAGQFSLTTVVNFIVHLPNFIRLFSRLLNDKRVPIHLKLICWASIVYFFFPFDFIIPDLARLGLGYIDDMVFLFYAFNKLVKESPPDVVREHVEQISRGERPVE
ncbi:MAG: DUF1232 domain-containing protein [bacterium]|jgi:uncharacterized membrane protein YkvA (DUF1232 family)|nr:DUF1232 domain-containing protein [bacterium]